MSSICFTYIGRINQPGMTPEEITKFFWERMAVVTLRETGGQRDFDSPVSLNYSCEVDLLEDDEGNVVSYTPDFSEDAVDSGARQVIPVEDEPEPEYPTVTSWYNQGSIVQMFLSDGQSVVWDWRPFRDMLEDLSARGELIVGQRVKVTGDLGERHCRFVDLDMEG